MIFNALKGTTSQEFHIGDGKSVEKNITAQESDIKLSKKDGSLVPVQIGDPTENTHAVTKSFVESHFTAMINGLPTVQVQKAGNVFDIDIPSTGQFVMVPDQAFILANGDHFTVGGMPFAAKTQNGEPLPDNFFTANSKVLVLYDESATTLWFIGAASSGSDDAVIQEWNDTEVTVGNPTLNNADLFGNQPPSYYATKEDVEDVGSANIPYEDVGLLPMAPRVADKITSGGIEYTALNLGTFIFKCTLLLDAWTGDDTSGYSQTVNVVKEESVSPMITANSYVFPFFIQKTGVAETDKVLEDSWRTITQGECTVGNGSLSFTKVPSKPTADALLYFTAKVVSAS